MGNGVDIYDFKITVQCVWIISSREKQKSIIWFMFFWIWIINYVYSLNFYVKIVNSSIKVFCSFAWKNVLLLKM